MHQTVELVLPIDGVRPQSRVLSLVRAVTDVVGDFAGLKACTSYEY